MRIVDLLKTESIALNASPASKTEAIDMSEQFVWLDDRPFLAEIEILKIHNCENKLIIVDLNNPNELKRIIKENLTI